MSAERKRKLTAIAVGAVIILAIVWPDGWEWVVAFGVIAWFFAFIVSILLAPFGLSSWLFRQTRGGDK